MSMLFVVAALSGLTRSRLVVHFIDLMIAKCVRKSENQRRKLKPTDENILDISKLPFEMFPARADRDDSDYSEVISVTPPPSNRNLRSTNFTSPSFQAPDAPTVSTDRNDNNVVLKEDTEPRSFPARHANKRQANRHPVSEPVPRVQVPLDTVAQSAAKSISTAHREGNQNAAPRTLQAFNESTQTDVQGRDNDGVQVNVSSWKSVNGSAASPNASTDQVMQTLHSKAKGGGEESTTATKQPRASKKPCKRCGKIHQRKLNLESLC